MINKALPIAQANALTESRYNFNRIEKNALYNIIRHIRNEYVEQSSEQTIYHDMKLEISEEILSEIADKAHRSHAKAALINLRHRDVTIEDEKGNWMNTGFITMSKYDIEKKKFTVGVSAEIIPYLVGLANQYTVYSLTVAISLKSKWAQRFYELCCQYKNHLENGTPTFHKSIGQLRHMFMLEDKYPKLPDFKKYVINKAYLELKESYDKGKCDVWFEYGQTRKGEKAEFKFIIHTKEIVEAQQKKFKELHEMSYEINKILHSILPKDAKFCDKCWNHLNLHPDKIEPLYGKLERIMKNYDKSGDRARVVRHMLDEDFNMTKKSI